MLAFASQYTPCGTPYIKRLLHVNHPLAGGEEGEMVLTFEANHMPQSAILIPFDKSQ